MNLINNWMQPVTLAAGETSLDLDLPDGMYRLSITDSASLPTRWEIIGTEVSGGLATLQRGLEGTLDQGWSDGSMIYADITAGMLGELYQRIASLEARVAAIETGSVSVSIAVGEDSGVVGFFDSAEYGQLGEANPQNFEAPGLGQLLLTESYWVIQGGVTRFNLALSGTLEADAFEAVDVEGYGLLIASTAEFYQSGAETFWGWATELAAAPWNAGEQRMITIRFP